MDASAEAELCWLWERPNACLGAVWVNKTQRFSGVLNYEFVENREGKKVHSWLK